MQATHLQAGSRVRAVYCRPASDQDRPADVGPAEDSFVHMLYNSSWDPSFVYGCGLCAPSLREKLVNKRSATTTFQKLAKMGEMDTRVTGHVCRVTGAQTTAVGS